MSNTKIHKLTYENLYFKCQSCSKKNILNRVSDLKTVMPISHL